MIHIAFISWEFPPDTGKGGIGTYLLEVCKLLQTLKIDCEIFCGSKDREISEIYQNIIVHRIKVKDISDFNNKVVRRFSKVHSINPFDLIETPEIHGHNILLKKAFPDIPVVVRLHCPNIIIKKFQDKFVPFKTKLRFVLGSIKQGKPNLGFWRKYRKEDDIDYQSTLFCDAITAPSEAMKEWAIKYWEIGKNNIQVCYNPFTPNKTLLDIPIKTTDQINIAFLGRFNGIKGVYDLPIIINSICKTNHKVTFHLYGKDGVNHNGDSVKKILQKKIDPCFTNQVFFYDGYELSELSKILEPIHICLFPSFFESSGYVVQEAMAAGKLTICRNVGGMKMIIKDKENGYLFNSTKDAIKNIKLVISSQNNMLKIAQQGRSELNRFNGSLLADQYYKTYQNVIQCD